MFNNHWIISTVFLSRYHHIRIIIKFLSVNSNGRNAFKFLWNVNHTMKYDLH